ncbi:phosphoenolpyruvate carboxykinase (GTP) [Nesterenkonia halobia]|uniref:Phosphoenolpyruvate carboxykinase [GTP] n=2 Tax=Nesterenkonia halobia TaxID=37922 RepID=A0ABP6RDU2_9MICC
MVATVAMTPGADIVAESPTTHTALNEFVSQIAELTTPDRIHWVDGGEAENRRLTDELVAAGTLTRLTSPEFPNSYAAFSDPSDVARVEESTFICSEREEDAGFTNNWRDPEEMRRTLSGLFSGSMAGRTMYVIPFVMGPLDAADPKFGVEITDSAYVVASMRIMTRIGARPLARMEELDAEFVPAVHSVGAPLAPGEQDVPWPCHDDKHIVHFPETREIWSFGSGYGGNALLGKKCFALRIASVMGRDEGWLAEHMLILKLTSPQGRTHYISGAFPSACGKTNLALIDPTLEGWTAETLGDDITWIRPGDDGELRAINPETGYFGVAPGTGWSTNANAMRAIAKGNSIFTNCALTDDGGVWWEGLTEEPPAHLIDWKGEDWTPDADRPAAHPNARFCTPIEQTDMLAEEFHAPEGVTLDAILFGGRRKTTIPLVTEARDWTHGIFFGATLSSETTAAAAGEVGRVRRDPMAMLPFIGYDAGDYLKHWIEVSGAADPEKLPGIFLVNWFRRGRDGKIAWPGFAENTRVLTWIIARLEGRAEARETPIGLTPTPESLELEGLDISDEALEDSLRVDPAEWRAELDDIEVWFDRFGDSMPQPILDELQQLRERVDAAG